MIATKTDSQLLIGEKTTKGDARYRIAGGVFANDSRFLNCF
jgi:hypothetical protein